MYFPETQLMCEEETQREKRQILANKGCWWGEESDGGEKKKKKEA